MNKSSKSFLSAIALAGLSSAAMAGWEWVTLSDGTRRRFRTPSENAVYYPMFLVDEGGESPERHPDYESELKKINLSAGDPLKAELDKYGMDAYRCMFDDETWSCLVYSHKDSKHEKLPMIVHVPGTGEIGPDLAKQFRHRKIFDIVTSEEFQNRHPCHFMALSPPGKEVMYYGGMEGRPNKAQRRTLIMVEYAMALRKARPLVDTERLYITGFSFGGNAAYMLPLVFPGKFAASVPIATVAPDAEFYSEDHPGNFWHIVNAGSGEWHAELVEHARKMGELVNGMGGDFRVSVYPGAEGHDAWTSAWGEDAVWDWMFSKTLSSKGKSRPGKFPAVDKAVPLSLAGAKCSATIPGTDETHDETRPIDMLEKTYYEPADAFSKNDWWQVELAEPISGVVKIVTGDPECGRLLKNGYVEVSGNGKTWRRVGAFSRKSGKSEFKSDAKFKFLRVRVGFGGQRDPFVIRNLFIYKIR